MIKSRGHPPSALLVLSPVAFVAIAVLLAACDGDDEADTTDDESAAEQEVVGAPEAGRTFRRECYPPRGNRPLESSFPEDNLDVGPVTFFGAGAFRMPDRDFFRQGTTNWSALKTVTQVSPPVEATVSVAEDDRSAFLLIYDSENFRGNQNYRRADGHATVVFGGCADASPPRDAAEFNGGFLARRPGCYGITVSSEADPEPVMQVNLSMGRGACGEPG